MAEKYPEIDVDANDQELGGDFLARESELLGDEFKTDQDKDVLEESDGDAEINDFKEQFPEVEGSANVVAQQEAEQQEDEEDEFEGFDSAPSATRDLSESEPLKEWKQRRDLEIEERESSNSKKKEDIISKAQQGIDDFYDNYNNKRESHAKDILKEQEEFLEKRDKFLSRGTLWDRVNELVGEVGELPEDNRDKTRFKGLLNKLKGKENVPGAGGYTAE
ncbi:hypothetical protein FT663_02596 [Candidozyma haemuli var. vulneris]|uniref:Clathrin light chain n=1 Tax=Candidozyma haemuli TaxID=45357 RepID=A0A2V1AYP8_9ASCO|nr:hypothetical protein CXQ85_002687 [[Candida] haemuloni]KAF3991723.1 hypothetical protein FT663_02596 [[Candida] haemuloni var. vulneris]KAF3992080.1 hypothetical protein FT662_01389 [[Candida] haemuloni var. vulneris]PVH22962.1 hypothetical protein CXQ85_002687 [[Candida] haemuloni]